MSKHEIHLSDIEDPQKQLQAQKSRWGASKILIAVIIIIGISFFSPLPRMLISLIPNSLVKSMISPLFIDLALDETGATRTDAFKLKHDNDLPILGRNSGICFIFNNINENLESKARRGYKIAEIIAISNDNKEYKLAKVTLNKINNDKDIKSTVICQKFGKRNSIMPRSINAIYVRPINPFTPAKIIWATKKDLAK